MKVAMVGPALTQRGGIVSVIQELNDFLKSRDIETTVISTTSEGGKLKSLRVFSRALISIATLSLFRKLDLVHIHMASRGSCLRKSMIAMTCWILQTPYIIHLHGGEFHKFYESEASKTSQYVIKFVFRKSSRVVALSKSWEIWLSTRLELKNITTIFNGVQGIRTVRSCAPSEITILFLGKLSPQKGLDNLISAMRIVSNIFPHAILEVGGDGDLMHYRELAEHSSNIRFLGWIGNEERSKTLSRSTIFCLPSWNEGLPMSILEAMSAGLPVVSTHVGGIPEVVENNITGILVQPGDIQGLAAALCKLLDDREYAKFLGHNGKTLHQNKFSSAVMGEKFLEVYSDCKNQ